MTAQLPISNDVQRAKLTARDFWTLADAGAFEGFAKTELIEGEIWVVNSVHTWHARTVAHFIFELETARRAFKDKLVIYTSASVDLSADSVPEPDVSVGETDDGKGLPLAKLRLAVEVSDSTLSNDLGRKAGLYAGAGVPEYWVVDRAGSRIVQMWSPIGNSYADRREVTIGDSVTAATLPGWTVETSGI